MPELPEVETVRNGLAPHILGHTIKKSIVRNYQLRWHIPKKLNSILLEQKIIAVTRRAKYLLIKTEFGTLIIHLGMSGKLCIVDQKQKPLKHDHVDIILDNGNIIRYTDHRRFGCILWTTDDPLEHKLLAHLGPEPLTNTFKGKYLYDKSRKIKKPIKQFLMDNKIVVGVGNIYANEALFYSKISPLAKPCDITLEQYNTLTKIIKKTLRAAIKQGGTTLRDFVSSDGNPGYFAQKLVAYGRGGEPCVKCEKLLIEVKLGGRTTVYCEDCQS